MERRETGLSPQAWTVPPGQSPGAELATTPPWTPVAVERPPAIPCANCGTALTGPFCAQCGQHIADFHQSVWRFVTDFLDNLFCWDNKLLRTLEPLFRQPGFLTREFMAGRRVRYVHPLRLFLFTSAVCLALLHFGVTTDKKHSRHGAKSAKTAVSQDEPPGKKAPAADDDDKDDADDARPSASPLPPEAAAVLAALAPVPAPATTAPAATVSPAAAASPGVTPSASPKAGDDPLAALIGAALKGKVDDQRAQALGKLGASLSRPAEQKAADGSVEHIGQQIVDKIRQRLSWMALALLPVFAVMLHALYRRTDSFYFQHLVFSLHYHTFLLMFWVAYTWLSTMLGGTFLHLFVELMLLGPPIYLFLALHRVYGDSVRRTWTKTILLGGMHLLAIIIGLAVIGASSLV